TKIGKFLSARQTPSPRCSVCLSYTTLTLLFGTGNGIGDPSAIRTLFFGTGSGIGDPSATKPPPLGTASGVGEPSDECLILIAWSIELLLTDVYPPNTMEPPNKMKLRTERLVTMDDTSWRHPWRSHVVGVFCGKDFLNSERAED